MSQDTVTAVAATVQSPATNDAAHSSMAMLGASGEDTSTATVRVDVAVVSVDVAAEKETVVVPETRDRVNVQLPLSSVVVVARVESYAAVTTEDADVVPINVTLVVANVSFSLGERMESVSGSGVLSGVSPPLVGVSIVCVGLPPVEPLEPPDEGGGVLGCDSV